MCGIVGKLFFDSSQVVDKRQLEMMNNTIGKDSSAAMYYFSAMLHAKAEKKDKSIELLETALDKFPNYRGAAEKLGIIRATEGHFSEAKVNLLKALSLGVGDDGGVIHGLLGLCYLKTGDGATAEYNYRIALKRNPENEDWALQPGALNRSPHRT